jgi:hypothetical protein
MQMASLRLDQPDTARALVTTGRLLAKVSSGAMPPGKKLLDADIAALRNWIEEGAVWPEPDRAARSGNPLPWSFRPLSTGPIVLAATKPEAPSGVLLRRLYLDLIGLPPTPDQIAGHRGQPHEEIVDTLLASPRFGEKWALHWLDLARYSDSEGGVQDYARPFAWRYREWVIDAFNRDMPFDQFTVEQLAGDLLPNAAVTQKIAAGFHRNTVTSREGGVPLEKIRYEQLVDRANTTGAAWLGLTVGCAQCHDHKYDPITQQDYYRLLAYFENAAEIDVDAPLPLENRDVSAYLEQRAQLLAKYNIPALQADWEVNLRHARANPGQRTAWDNTFEVLSKLVDNTSALLDTPPAERTIREQDRFTLHFARSSSDVLGKERVAALKLKEFSDALNARKEKHPLPSQILTFTEAQAKQPTVIRLRGDYQSKGATVTPATPAALGRSAAPDRLALARWIVAENNPLTARVAVNRIWQELFGRGLVTTPDDFGNQGQPPTDSKLLDALAADFQSNGWRTKRLIRQLVLSPYYRQAGAPRRRLPAELIRDSALQSAGLLSATVGGPSIKLPQPDGIADLAYSLKWEPTQGPDRYKRGIYVHVQRTAPNPLLMNFDAPDRLTSCSRRENSVSPLQALNLFNDPVFIEAAEALAARIERQPAVERIDTAYLLTLARRPTDEERRTIENFLSKNESWFAISRVLLNLDEFLSRE